MVRGGNALFRSGRIPDPDTGSTRPRRGRRGGGARATMDLGRLGRNAELGLGEGEQDARARSSRGIGALLGRLFKTKPDHSTRPTPREGIAPAARKYGNLGDRDVDGLGSSRLRPAAGRAAAASSLGSLQSYATSTIRGTGSGCLSPGSTSEVDVRKRVNVRRDESERFVFSEKQRDNTLLSQRPEAFTYPEFALGDYGGPDDWPSDVFVLLHNAIRWEIMDLYNILGSIQRRWATLQMIDVWDLSEYWEVFEVFVMQYFEIEDQIIFPFMLNVAADSPDLSRYYKVVKYNKERLQATLHEVGLTLEKFNTQHPGEVMPVLYMQLKDCLPKLLGYMNEQEKVMPKVFQEYCEREDRTLLNRASANFLVRATNGRHGIAILTRWIEDYMVLNVWKNENLSPRAKNSHKKWLATLRTEHVDIVARFQSRMRNYREEAPRAKDRSRRADRADRADPGSGAPGGRSNLRDASVAAALAP